ncbi:MFS transporter [Streptomyces sp. NRRL S-646]|uniref:MFS transporter n=1 Tax=Streptomyces sp. NRRL S-646 TaxID=1463917 RepID=UPI001331B3EA|nr:MFS transporter [Streptomyces sp. NRRL S-646]
MVNEATAEGSLWRHPGFVRYWSANAVDFVGSGVTQVAIPLIAVVALHASVWQVALLSFAQKLPPLLVSLPAGVLADRYRKRPVMVGAALVGGVAFLIVPLACELGWLSLGLLYGVALVGAVSEVFGSTARISFLPSLLPRSRLLEANSKLGGVNSLADSAGAQLGGVLITVLGAAPAIYLDVASYLACALFLFCIRTTEPAVARPTRNATFRAEIAEGMHGFPHHAVVSLRAAPPSLFGCGIGYDVERGRARRVLRRLPRPPGGRAVWTGARHAHLPGPRPVHRGAAPARHARSPVASGRRFGDVRPVGMRGRPGFHPAHRPSGRL